LDSETILDILGNDTRRKILQLLSEEPMYFNQLAKEIGIGQQAVLRHLVTLEQGGIIEAYSEKSDLGAPDRKYYKLNSSFVLRISLSEDDFTIENQTISETRQKYKPTPKAAGEALSHLQANLLAVEQEISSVENRLRDLYALKQQILHRLHQVGRDNFDSSERRVLYRIIEESPKSMAELSDMVDEKESSLRAMLTSIANKMDEKSARLLFEDLD
jgi:ArsR family transcriptional regulator